MADAPWVPEWEVTPATVEALLAAHAPALAGGTLRPLASGWDNLALTLDHPGGRAIVRVPKRRIALALLAAELDWLPRLAPHLPVACSAPRWGVRGLAEAPYAFAAYPFIAGTPGHDLLAADPPAAVAEAMGRSLGRFLGALHRIPVDRSPGAPPLPDDGPERSDLRAVLAHVRGLRPRLARGVPQPLLDACIAALDTLARSRPQAWTKPCWVHGDLDHRHTLFHESGELAGVIDWGDLHVGDPALDLALWWSVLPLGARHSFQTAYGPVDAHSWRRARARCLVHQLYVLDWATQTDKPTVAGVARWALERALG